MKRSYHAPTPYIVPVFLMQEILRVGALFKRQNVKYYVCLIVFFYIYRWSVCHTLHSYRQYYKNYSRHGYKILSTFLKNSYVFVFVGWKWSEFINKSAQLTHKTKLSSLIFWCFVNTSNNNCLKKNPITDNANHQDLLLTPIP